MLGYFIRRGWHAVLVVCGTVTCYIESDHQCSNKKKISREQNTVKLVFDKV